MTGLALVSAGLAAAPATAGPEPAASSSAARTAPLRTAAAAGASRDAAALWAGPVREFAPRQVAGPVLVPGRATARSNTWLLPDGEFRTEVYGAAVNYRDAHGDWVPIDNRLVDSDRPGVAVVNAANDFTVQLPRDASARPVRLVAGDRWVGLAMAGLGGAPDVTGSEATYTPTATPAGPSTASSSGPAAGTSTGSSTASDTSTAGSAEEAGADASAAAAVTYRATAAGVKESIRLDEAPAGAVAFSYALSMSPGLRPVVNEAGGLDILDGSGAPVFRVPAGIMLDSSAEQAVSTQVAYRLSQSAAGWRLLVVPDAGWLADPARVYPVVVDPSVLVLQEKIADCWVSSTNTATSHCDATADVLRAGVMSTGEKRRSLLRFDLSGVPANASVSAATLSLYMDSTRTTTGTSANWSVRRAVKAWDETATWAKPTQAGTATWAGGGGWPTGEPDYGTRPLTGTSSGWRGFDVTGLASQWVSGALVNNGMVLKQDTETVTNQIAFISSESTITSEWPKLSVTYTEPDAPGAAADAGDQRFWTYTSEQLDERLSAKVNVGNGNLLVTAHDAHVAGVAGLDLAVDRYYNSAVAASTGSDVSRLGPGWSDNLGGSVRLEFPNSDDS
ncbi:MAG TPA: DNRLRE domain-containing protein, partial [Kineosporiaceae bacterium]